MRKKLKGKRAAGVKKLSLTEQLLSAVDPNSCLFCESGESTDPNGAHGQLIHTDHNFSIHYFCMLFASGLYQRGNVEDEKDQLKGFLRDDIIREKRRASKLRCSFCKEPGAPTGCIEKKCNTKYHFSCGRKNGVLFQFFGSFCTFCADHRPHQSFPRPTKLKRRRLRFVGMAKTQCAICILPVSTRASNNTLITPCCKRAFHRMCMQNMGTCSGFEHFKCPTCNNVNEFRMEMLRFGIYLPDQDAAWELEPNAFGDHYAQYSHCDAKTCLNPQGRDHHVDAENHDWEIVRCRMCGSQAIHWRCNQYIDKYTCPMCSSIRTKRKEAKRKKRKSAGLDGDLPKKTERQSKFKGAGAKLLKKLEESEARKRKRVDSENVEDCNKKRLKHSDSDDTISISFDDDTTTTCDENATNDDTSGLDISSDDSFHLDESDATVENSPVKIENSPVKIPQASASKSSIVTSPKKSIKITNFFVEVANKNSSLKFISNENGNVPESPDKIQAKRGRKPKRQGKPGGSRRRKPGPKPKKKNLDEDNEVGKRPAQRNSKRSKAAVNAAKTLLDLDASSAPNMSRSLMTSDLCTGKNLGSAFAENSPALSVNSKANASASEGTNGENRHKDEIFVDFSDDTDSEWDVLTRNIKTETLQTETSLTDSSQNDDFTLVLSSPNASTSFTKLKGNMSDSTASETSQNESFKKTKQVLISSFFGRKNTASASLGKPIKQEPNTDKRKQRSKGVRSLSPKKPKSKTSSRPSSVANKSASIDKGAGGLSLGNKRSSLEEPLTLSYSDFLEAYTVNSGTGEQQEKTKKITDIDTCKENTQLNPIICVDSKESQKEPLRSNSILQNRKSLETLVPDNAISQSPTRSTSTPRRDFAGNNKSELIINESPVGKSPGRRSRKGTPKRRRKSGEGTPSREGLRSRGNTPSRCVSRNSSPERGKKEEIDQGNSEESPPDVVYVTDTDDTSLVIIDDEDTDKTCGVVTSPSKSKTDVTESLVKCLGTITIEDNEENNHPADQETDLQQTLIDKQSVNNAHENSEASPRRGRSRPSKQARKALMSPQTEADSISPVKRANPLGNRALNQQQEVIVDVEEILRKDSLGRSPINTLRENNIESPAKRSPKRIVSSKNLLIEKIENRRRDTKHNEHNVLNENCGLWIQ